MKIFILTEGSKDIGFGHITRCTSLYQAFKEKGVSPELIVHGDDSTYQLLDGKYKIMNWLENKNEIFNVLNGADIAIIDSYLADRDFYEQISKLVKIPVYIDDNKRLEYPRGVVLNGTIGADGMDYPKKEGVTYLLGSKYVLLRKRFWNIPKKKIKKHVETVMITFGGDDSKNMTSKVLKLVQEVYQNAEKNVVIGKGFKNLDEIKNLKDNTTKLIYYPNAEGMYKIMLKSDIAISAGGQTLCELARVGVPTIAIAVADNQLNNIKGWQAAGFIEYGGWWNDNGLLRNLKKSLKMLEDRVLRDHMSKIGRTLVDGGGSRRAVEEILEMARITQKYNITDFISASGETRSKPSYLKGVINLPKAVLINFINMTDKEKEMVRLWRNHENVRKWVYQDHIINIEEHLRFIAGLKENNKDFNWLVKDKENNYIGVISINKIDFRNKNAYLGIYANPETKIQGAGRLLIECLKIAAFEFLNLHTLKLEVVANNDRAINFYKRAGFEEEGKLKEFILKDDRLIDMFIMGIVKKDGIKKNGA